MCATGTGTGASATRATAAPTATTQYTTAAPPPRAPVPGLAAALSWLVREPVALLLMGGALTPH